MEGDRLIDLEWRIPRRGFRWHSEGPDLLHLYPVARDEKAVRPTRPMQEEPRLFQKFAALDRSPESVLRFANQHGSVFGDDPEPCCRACSG